MDLIAVGKSLLIFLILAMTVAVNVEDNVMARLRIDQDILKIALFAVVVTGLIAHQNLFLIVLVLFLSFGANMPADFMLNFGIDRDYFLGALVAIVLFPVVWYALDW